MEIAKERAEKIDELCNKLHSCCMYVDRYINFYSGKKDDITFTGVTIRDAINLNLEQLKELQVTISKIVKILELEQK